MSSSPPLAMGEKDPSFDADQKVHDLEYDSEKAPVRATGDARVDEIVNAAETGEIGEQEKKKVLRKLDLALMPLMCISVLLQFLDKTSLNYANLLGIKTDLGLHGQQYSWLGSIFYIGYLAASPVHGFFLQRVSLSAYVGANIIIWGLVLGCHAACTNYAGLVACRLLLGVFEGAITPGFILMTGRFYRRQEQVVRTGIWFSMNGWAQILGGGIAYGVQVQKPSSLRVWQQLYVILGCITFTYGLVVFFLMPSSPDTTRLLSAREKRVALERIRENKTGLNDPKFRWEQAIEAVQDPRLYLFFLGVAAANVANGGVSNFGSEIIRQFGYSSKDTSLLGMAPGLAEVVFVLFAVYIAAWTRTRVIPGVTMFLLAIAGGAMMIGIPASNKAGRMAGYAIVFAYPCASPLYYSWLSSCIGGTSKKILFNVFLQLGYCAGNIIGPQTYRANEAPDYHSAKATLIAMFVVSSLCLIGIWAFHYSWNKKRDAQYGKADAEESIEDVFSDETDFNRKSFRYPY